MDVNIRELRRQLAYFVTLAEKGETVRIIRHSYISAQLGPLDDKPRAELTFRQVSPDEDTTEIQLMFDAVDNEIRAAQIVRAGELWVGEAAGQLKLAGGFYRDRGHYSYELGFGRLVVVPPAALAAAAEPAAEVAKMAHFLRQRAAARGVTLGALEN